MLARLVGVAALQKGHIVRKSPLFTSILSRDCRIQGSLMTFAAFGGPFFVVNTVQAVNNKRETQSSEMRLAATGCS